MNAALSGMYRFYLRPALVTSAKVLVCVMAVVAPATGQSPALPEQPLLGTAISAEMLRQLPASNNPITLLDTAQTEAIGDRFLAGGLSVVTPPRIGGLLNSWTQTEFRIGDIAITDPLAGGRPLLLPILPLADRITIATGALGIDETAAGLSMTNEPPRAAARGSARSKACGPADRWCPTP